MKRIKQILILVTGILAFSSCSRDTISGTTPTPTTTQANEINDFVWKALNSWYYWQPNVPKLADSFKNSSEYATFLNSKTPDALFYSLLYNYGTIDKFSWIENNNIIIPASKIAEIEKISGMDYGVYPKDNSNTAAVALVNYVVPGSPADLAGIKRGDVITKVNGSQLTLSNYNLLNQNQVSVTRAATVTLTSSGLVTTDKAESILITKSNIDENPVAFYKKFTYGGKNIGYLVYNGFKLDYNDELNAAFAQMKADGITELILDLRYNGGGSLETASALAQMITGSFTGQPYVYLDFNDKHNAEDGMEFLKNTVNTYNYVNGYPEQTGTQSVNSLNLNKIYTLVSFQTASASELTVSCLKKYINIVTIGYQTVGKFVGSITLYDSPNQDFTSFKDKNPSHNWQLQPITFAYFNKDKDPAPTSGLIPNFEINPYQAFNNIKEFGNTSDPELNKALQLITGLTTFKVPQQNIYLNNTLLTTEAFDHGAKGLNIPNFDEFRKRR